MHQGRRFGRGRRMADRPDPVQIAAPPDIREPHQQHGEEHAQVEHRGQGQRSRGKRGQNCFFVPDAVGAWSAPVNDGTLPAAACWLLGQQMGGLAEHGGRRKEEGHFHLENQEHQRHDVEPQVELHRARANGRLAALVGLRLSAALGARARSSFPNRRDASTNRNPTVANSAK